jgi:hypothetical protein
MRRRRKAQHPDAPNRVAPGVWRAGTLFEQLPCLCCPYPRSRIDPDPGILDDHRVQLTLGTHLLTEPVAGNAISARIESAAVNDRERAIAINCARCRRLCRAVAGAGD